MGLFRKKASNSAKHDQAFQKALDDAGQLDIAADFPSATPEQSELMEQMWIGVVSKVGGAGSFDPQQVAAMSTLGERLVADSPALGAFIERLRGIAEAESSRRPTDPSWRALVRHL
ncbi:hypothetical protein [Nocardioides gilvus]|uniref:hypothetical protein n=1 Tax=Nocardioides gilvus TaxID=1735589 RepID=UPI0013A5A2F1|nr:hypothetical protein [Nocardioides gilvus]